MGAWCGVLVLSVANRDFFLSDFPLFLLCAVCGRRPGACQQGPGGGAAGPDGGEGCGPRTAAAAVGGGLPAHGGGSGGRVLPHVLSRAVSISARACINVMCVRVCCMCLCVCVWHGCVSVCVWWVCVGACVCVMSLMCSFAVLCIGKAGPAAGLGGMGWGVVWLFFWSGGARWSIFSQLCFAGNTTVFS